jgi:hypothetical protein
MMLLQDNSLKSGFGADAVSQVGGQYDLEQQRGADAMGWKKKRTMFFK